MIGTSQSRRHPSGRYDCSTATKAPLEYQASTRQALRERILSGRVRQAARLTTAMQCV